MCLAKCLKSVLNVKALVLVGAFNQEEALVVIVKLREGSFPALIERQKTGGLTLDYRRDCDNSDYS